MFDGVLNMPLYPKCVIMCPVILCNELKHIKNLFKFRNLFFKVTSGWDTPLYAFDLRLIEICNIQSIFKYIHAFSKHFKKWSTIFTHILVLFSHIQVYSSIFRTLCDRSIFRTLAYLKSWNITKPTICRT